MRDGKDKLTQILPPAAGLLLVVMFTSLGFWQLERADEKRRLEALFARQGEQQPLDPARDYALYQPLSVHGRFLADRQFLLENTILDGRVGYYVVTPLEYAADAPLLLVNRGWAPADGDPRTVLSVADEPQRIGGRVGQLPRVGIRAGEAFPHGAGWPRRANWPGAEEIAGAIGREVLPFVLLADPDPASPLIRRWQPRVAGPVRHLGYAVQWFGLALTVVVVAAVLYRRKWRSR